MRGPISCSSKTAVKDILYNLAVSHATAVTLFNTTVHSPFSLCAWNMIVTSIVRWQRWVRPFHLGAAGDSLACLVPLTAVFL